MTFRLSRRTIAAVLAVVAAAAATLYFIQQRRQVSQALPLPSLRTVCVGRMLVDLPEEMTLSGDVEFFYGLTADHVRAKVQAVKANAGRRDLERAVNERIAELKNRYERKAPEQHRYISHRTVDDNTVVVLSYGEAMIGELVEVFVLRGSALGLMSRDVYQNEGGRIDRREDIESALITMASRTTAVGDPAEAGKGTCIGGLLINDHYDGEVFSVGARDSKHPDLVIEVFMNSMISKSDGGLLKRWDRRIGMMAELGVRPNLLRRGSVTVVGRAGEQLVDTQRYNGKMARIFAAETLLRSPATFAEPYLKLNMNLGGQVPSGEYVDPSFTEADSLVLWDRILKSIRPRPGAV
jgi:Tle cognate immunity protein 4 C-terminal domain